MDITGVERKTFFRKIYKHGKSNLFKFFVKQNLLSACKKVGVKIEGLAVPTIHDEEKTCLHVKK